MKIGIIGAGLSGLVIANKLKNLADITVFEKSRGVGGRMSTKRDANFEFDHGVPFFRAKTKDFQDFLKPLEKESYINIWEAKFVEIDRNVITHSQQWNKNVPHYVGSPYMNSINKYLAKDINILLNTKIVKIERDEKSWVLFDEKDQNLGSYDWIISTAPPAQSGDLLPDIFSYNSILRNITMKACYSLMLGFSESFALDWDCALVKGSNISFMSVNNSKPMRNENYSLVVLSTNSWADDNIESEQDWVIKQMMLTIQNIIVDMKEPSYVKLHKWRYANLPKQKQKNCLIDFENHLASCGDWCLGGRVEDAFLAANKLSSILISKLLESDKFMCN